MYKRQDIIRFDAQLLLLADVADELRHRVVPVLVGGDGELGLIAGGDGGGRFVCGVVLLYRLCIGVLVDGLEHVHQPEIRLFGRADIDVYKRQVIV